jgi:polysaccharide deacetylase 2 family uncharacterized protein YibQ
MSTNASGSSRFRRPRSMRRKARPRRRQPSVFRRKFFRWLLIAAIILVAVVGLHQMWQRGYLAGLFRRAQPVEDLTDRCDRLDAAIRLSLDDLGASPIFILQSQEDREEETRRWRFRRLTVRVTDQISLLHCNLAITRAVEETGGQVLSGEQSPGGDRLTLEVGLEGVPTHRLELISDRTIAPTKGRLALIIDDFGAIDNQVAEDILELPVVLTAAIIPGHPSSGRVAQKAHQAGHDVLVHLPMQPKEGQTGEENTILVDLPEDEIRRRVRWALNEIPGAVGVNNHMGSLATENEKVMRTVLEEVKEAGLFFVDSRTSSASVACQVAAEVDVTCIRSEGFLDYQDEGAEIKGQLEKLADQALQKGTAVGIGHVKANTLGALQEMIPRLEKNGVRFCRVSRVLTARQKRR